MLYALNTQHERSSAHHRHARVLQSLRRLGGGLHPLRRIVVESGLHDSTVQRILRAACDEGFLVYRRPALYGFATAQVLDPGVSPLLPHGSALNEHMKRLQRETAQVTLACTAVLIDSFHARHCIHRVSGPRYDFQEALDRSDNETRLKLIYAPLSEDAAGLAILAGLEGTPPSKRDLVDAIREQGYVVTPAMLEGWHMLAVPLWQGEGRVIGSLALLGRRAQIERHQDEYASAARRAAADLSSHYEIGDGPLRLAS